MDKIIDLLPEFLQSWSLGETAFYTIPLLILLLLINTAVQNKVTDFESRNGIKLGLGVITGLWFLFTVFMMVIKVFAII